MSQNNIIQEERDNALKANLPEGIVKLINRLRLVSTEDLKWISKKENSHEQVIFTQKFLQNNDTITALFRANYLCFAKLKYFRENINKYEPAKYDPDRGFIKTELWDSDFLKHIASGKYLDYRFLQRITDIEVFNNLCKEMEEY